MSTYQCWLTTQGPQCAKAVEAPRPSQAAKKYARHVIHQDKVSITITAPSGKVTTHFVNGITPGAKQPPPEVMQIIQERIRMGEGYRQISKHLKGLGHSLSHETIRRVLRQRGERTYAKRDFDGFDEDVLWFRNFLENSVAGRHFMQYVRENPIQARVTEDES